MPEITKEVLRDYLNDALPPDRAAAVERRVREEPQLLALVAEARAEADPADHSVGAVWRRERLSCPSRETLSSFVQDLLDADHAEYVRFHLIEICCPACNANRDDLARLRDEPVADRARRRKRIVDSSAGELRGGAS